MAGAEGERLSNNQSGEYTLKETELFLVIFKDGTLTMDRVGKLDKYVREKIQMAFLVPEDTPLYKISAFYARGFQSPDITWVEVYTTLVDKVE